MLKICYYIFALVFLVYLIFPGPTRVEEFAQFPNSLKSDEPGDTTQIPNVAAYFTQNFRVDIIPFYKQEFSNKFSFLGLNMPFIRLNHPPLYAGEVIRPYQQSYYLEEFVHPLRESLYVNGWEPYNELGRARFKYSHPIAVQGESYKTKVTLRYYVSPIWVRLVIWLGVVSSVFLLFKVAKKALKENYG